MQIRGDDSNAFGQPELLKINFVVPEGQIVSKAELYINNGDIVLTFNSPTSPIEVNLTGAQTAILKDNNACDLVLYDGNDKQLTIPCIAEFKTGEGVK